MKFSSESQTNTWYEISGQLIPEINIFSCNWNVILGEIYSENAIYVCNVFGWSVIEFGCAFSRVDMHLFVSNSKNF